MWTDLITARHAHGWGSIYTFKQQQEAKGGGGGRREGRNPRQPNTSTPRCHLYLNATPVTCGSEVSKPGANLIISGESQDDTKEEEPLQTPHPRQLSICESVRSIDRDKLWDEFLKGSAGKRATGRNTFNKRFRNDPGLCTFHQLWKTDK